MPKSLQNISILGAGLVGTLLAIELNRLGYKVSVFEKRADPRLTNIYQGKSINLALSNRGIKALQRAGLDYLILSHAIPMKGRMIHKLDGSSVFQPYHILGKCIYSISRANLNQTLVDFAESAGVRIEFEHSCKRVDFKNQQLEFLYQNQNKLEPYEFLFGTDGAFSVLRKEMQSHAGFDFSQKYLEYGYKELHIAPNKSSHLEKNALHIWPRQDFMLIALPNTDGSFTCTLFLKLHGENSFEKISDERDTQKFFDQYFKDLLPFIDQGVQGILDAPIGNMLTIKSSPWNAQPNTCLLGDAAHAIVPFYGQGMNAGFEGVSLLTSMLEKSNDFQHTIELFSQQRVIDTNAIAELALYNFVEMRDLVDDEGFILRKKIEHYLSEKFPDQYQTVYEQVTFSDAPYRQALNQDILQKKMFAEMVSNADIKENFLTPIAKEHIERIARMYGLIQ